MNVLLRQRAYTQPLAIPTLVLVDLQQEYIAPPRGLAIPEIQSAIDNCAAALKCARTIGLPVAHMRWTGNAAFFNAATRYGNWIDGFTPLGSEMIFERAQPSCYSSERFSEVMGRGKENFVLAGFAGESACLATIIEAFHRNHHVTYLDDASGSHALEGFDSQSCHKMIGRLASLYGTTMSTCEWIALVS